MSKTYVSLSLALLAGLSLSSSLPAQPWEKAYGPAASEEEGHRRVTPVTQCPGRGYIAIGTHNLGSQTQVYLVRTDDAGVRIWEHYFDIGADGQSDQGLALVELRDGTGFMTTGTSERGFQAVAHSLRVDCDGRPLFSHFYGPQFAHIAGRVTGHDIREAVVGDNITTKPGDFIIAGYFDDGASTSDAVLLRINSSGNLVWHRRYDTGFTERFYGLTEARPNVNGGGDIIAVGDWRDNGRSQALAARVNGNDGSINPLTYQCMAIFGDAGEENFQSVVEIRLSPFTGALAMAGQSSSPGQLEDVYLVETKPSPCSMIAQTTIGNEFFGTYTELATDLIEVLAPVNSGLGVPLGSLALTGYAENSGSAGDAFLLFASQGSLLPITARIYGDHRGSKDWGTSLQQLRNTLGPVVQPRGFVIAGTTTTDWDGSGDRRDLYLIQPNDKASTGCEKEWWPDGYEWRWPLRQIDPHIDKVVIEEEVRVDGHRDDTMIRICQ